MNKKKILTYLACIFIPLSIFFVVASLTGYLPVKKELLNAYDSFTQYPGFILEFARNLFGGNLFYSFKGALGFNLFGSLTYYAFSPLNLLSLFANPLNYPYFIAFMTYLRVALLGFSMCFYLDHKNTKPSHTILFSTIFALSGFMTTYYYNYIWIDSIIMLPLVIYGLEKIIDEDKPKTYIFTLSITILINYYIGYMICIFSLIWFIYRIITKKNKKKLIKTFLISSLLSGLLCAFVILPSMFALLKGKSDLFNMVDYFKLNINSSTFLYNLTIGTYQVGDQQNGPALIYTSIIVVVLTIFYFYTSVPSKKEKFATLFIILLFYLSFSVNFLNYGWQFFQSPIWWQSRFSFLFSFFLITVAEKALSNLDTLNFSRKARLITVLLLIACILIGSFKRLGADTQIFTYIYLGFSILLLLEMIFILDKKGFLTMFIIFTFIELTCNSHNSLKANIRQNLISDYSEVKKDIYSTIKKLDEKNDFYRFELKDAYTSNDGLYFGYNGINHFNSVRNRDTLNFLKSFGLKVQNDCNVTLDSIDPLILSLLNIKYVYGSNIVYLNKIDENLYENPYPLSLMFKTKTPFKELDNLEGVEFRNELLKALTGQKDDVYTLKDITSFEYTYKDKKDTYEYSFKADHELLLFFENHGGKITINDKIYSTDNRPLVIKKDDDITISYEIITDYTDEDIYVYMLNLNIFESYMNLLSENTVNPNINKDGHLIDVNLTIDDEFNFVFTSIPYEEGMKVYANDKQIDITLIQNSLIGMKLDPGTYHITIDYTPKGLKLGIIISLFSLISIIIYLQTKKKAL